MVCHANWHIFIWSRAIFIWFHDRINMKEHIHFYCVLANGWPHNSKSECVSESEREVGRKAKTNAHCINMIYIIYKIVILNLKNQFKNKQKCMRWIKWLAVCRIVDRWEHGHAMTRNSEKKLFAHLQLIALDRILHKQITHTHW